MKLRTTPISIPAGPAWLDGVLAHAPDVRGLALILLPGALRESRDAHLAAVLQGAGFATLSLHLLTRYEESRDPDARYNVPLLATRVEAAGEWISHQPLLERLAVGLVATGTASGAAIRVAARAPERFPTLVCRAGRPDLAGAGPLRALRVPVRFIVGEQDPGRDIVTQAYGHLTAPHDWQTVKGAGELFQEPGTLDTASRLAAEWLERTLPPPNTPDTEAPHPRGPAAA